MQRTCENCRHLLDSVQARMFEQTNPPHMKLKAYFCDFCWNEIKFDDTGNLQKIWITKLFRAQLDTIKK